MNLALLIRGTLPGGSHVLFSGCVSSHSISQAVSLLVGSAGSYPAAGKPCLTTSVGKLAGAAAFGCGRVNGGCPPAVTTSPLNSSTGTPPATSRRKPAKRRRRRRDGIGGSSLASS